MIIRRAISKSQAKQFFDGGAYTVLKHKTPVESECVLFEGVVEKQWRRQLQIQDIGGIRLRTEDDELVFAD